MDPTYAPQNSETRQVYGISLRQNRNDAKIDTSLFSNIVTAEKSVCWLPHSDPVALS
jgi:phosphoribosylaminoimidazolecarboxamide formyltransferase/IMP cyclohydrolase